MSGTTTIPCPQGFFLNDAVTPTVTEDLVSAIAIASSALNGITASGAAAAASAAAAATSDNDAVNQAAAAAASASAAATSATSATSAATAAAGSVNSATTQANAASASATAAANSATAAATSATTAGNSATAAANSASTAASLVGNVPAATTGAELNYPRINASGTAYELRTPAQVAADINAVTAAGGTLTGPLNGTQFSSSAQGTSGNQLVNFSQFAPGGSGSSHFIHLPGGKTMQWGSGLTSVGNLTVTFPYTFSGVPEAIVCTAQGAGAGGENYAYVEASPSPPAASQFVAVTVTAGTGALVAGAFYWFAIGPT